MDKILEAITINRLLAEMIANKELALPESIVRTFQAALTEQKMLLYGVKHDFSKLTSTNES